MSNFNLSNCVSGRITNVEKYIKKGNLLVSSLNPLPGCSTIGSYDNKFCEVHTEELFVENNTLHFTDVDKNENEVTLKVKENGCLVTTNVNGIDRIICPAQTGATGATGHTGPTGPCCTGPTGPTGEDGISNMVIIEPSPVNYTLSSSFYSVSPTALAVGGTPVVNGQITILACNINFTVGAMGTYTLGTLDPSVPNPTSQFTSTIADGGLFLIITTGGSVQFYNPAEFGFGYAYVGTCGDFGPYPVSYS